MPEPQRNGYTFAGWFLNNTEYLSQYSKVSSALTLKAKWLSNHTLSFDSNGGSKVDDKLPVTNGLAIDTLPTTTRTGYTFLGWYYGDTKYAAGMIYPLEKDITLKAKWQENTSSTISTDGGVKVTGLIPAEAKISALEPYLYGSTVSKIRQYAAGTSLDFVQISLAGDGISGDLQLTIELPVGSPYRATTIYYYDSSADAVKTVTGTIAEGMLKFNVKGNTTSSGMDIVIGIVAGSDLPNHI